MENSKKIVLTFPPELTEVPIVYRLVKDYDLILNILRAEVRESAAGKMVIELTGEEKAIEAGVKYLTDSGLQVRNAEMDIDFREAGCTHCGACVPHCLGEALKMGEDDRLHFDRAACVLCGRCVAACPLRLFRITF